ncbi:MAG: hypothetical protein ACKODH_08675 [Limisphaerales bacterium]
MKSLFRTLVITSLAAAVMLGAPATSLAAEKEKGKEKADEKGKGDEKKKAGVVPFNGKAAAVDKAAKTIKLSGEKARVVQITDTTKVQKDGKPASLDELKEGEDVSGAYKWSADGKMEATVLNIGKPPAKKKEEKKDEKKEEKK